MIDQNRTDDGQFRLLFENSPEAMWVFDRDSLKFLEVNSAARGRYGYTSDEFLTMRLTDIRPEADRERLVAHIREQSPQFRRSSDWVHQRKDGSLLDVSVQSHSIVYAGNRAVLTVITDVTQRNQIERERHAAQAAVEKTNQQLGNVLESMSDGFVGLDLQGRVTHMNRQAEIVLDAPRAAVIGTVFWHRERPFDVSAIEAPLLRAARDRIPVVLEWHVARLDRWFDVRAMPTNDGLVLHLRDITGQRAERQALVDSEQRFRIAFDDAVFGMALATPDGRFFRVNGALRAFLGYDEEELLTKVASDLAPLEDVSRNQALRERALTGEISSYRMEKQYLHKSGRVLWGDMGATFVRDPNGAVLYSFAQVQDITARKDAEAALIDSENTLRTFLRNFPSGSINVFDADLRYLFAEGKGLTRFGLKPARFVGRTIFDIFPSAHIESIEPHYREALSGKEVTFDLPIGEQTFEIHAAPLRREKGRVTAIIAIAVDVTERVRMQDALRLSEERFRALTENGSDVISVVARDGSISYVSAGLTALVGFTPSEIQSHRFFEYIHLDDLPAVAACFASVVEGRQLSAKIVYRFRHKDGSYRWAESIGNGQLENPAIRGVVVNTRDVTERVLFQAQIAQTDKMAALGELVAGVAHEINNPLAAISGNAQLMRLHSDPSVREDAGQIEQMAERINRIVTALRTFARPSGGVKERKLGQLNDIVSTALSILQHRLRSSGVEIERALAPDLPLLSVNVGEIEQVVVNLVSNAEQELRKMPITDRRVRVSTSRACDGVENGFCRLTIRDTGAGMSGDVKKRIFDPFFTTKDIGEGTGLGLYISHGIISAHGGTIEVDTREGSGTTFTVSLPTPG